MSYYKILNGVKYDRAILDDADRAVSDGQVSFKEANYLWNLAADGPGITDTEKVTLTYIVDNYKCTKKAADYLRHMIASITGDSYYRIINGAQYDRKMLQIAERAVADGDISINEAKEIVKSATDGVGVTKVEEDTLQYILDKFKTTAPAHEVLTKALAPLRSTREAAELADDAKAAEAAAAAKKAEEEGAAADEATKKKLAEEKAAADKKKAEEEAAEKKAARHRRWLKEEMRILELEEQFGAIFDEMDVSGDGNLSHNELKQFVAKKDEAARIKLGIGKWQEFLSEADADGDGQVSRIEFVTFFSRVQELDPDRCFGALFDAIDVSGDGSLAYGEIRDYQWYKNPRVFQVLGISNFTDMVQKMDADGNGTVDRQEFVDYMKTRGMDLSWKKAAETSAAFGVTSGTKRKADDNASGANGTPELLALAKKCELDLSGLALDALKTLATPDAEALIKGLASGGQYQNVLDKNFFIIQDVKAKKARTS